MEESWPYFQKAISYSAPNGIGFFNVSEAERIYNKISKCLGCESSADYSCLQEKTPKEIVDCSWGGPMLTEDGPSNICELIFDPHSFLLSH